MMGEFATYSPSSATVEAVSVCGIRWWRSTELRTYENRPDVDEDEKDDISKLLQRKDKGEDMVGHTLREPVYGVEGVARKWRRYDPLVMGLMQRFVQLGMMQAAVDPVDEEIGEADEKGELQEVVESKRCIRGCVVQFRVPADLDNEAGRG